MIPVEQTHLEPPTGNCFAACLASILELPLEVVPQITAVEGASEAGQERYWYRVRAWLNERNLDFTGYKANGRLVPHGYAVLTVDCGPWWHCVVTWNGEVVWNPDPRRDRLSLPGPDRYVDWLQFAIMDPSKPVPWPSQRP